MKTLNTMLLMALLGLHSGVQAAEIALPEMGDSAGELISPQEEFQIGQGFFWQLQNTTDLVEDPEVTTYIQSLGDRLVSHSDEPGRPFQFFMVPNPVINAFAAPGGFIGVNTGLLLAADTEDELASVLAHEISHVTQRHILRSFENYQRLTVPRTAALVAAALLGVASPAAGQAALLSVQAGTVQSQIDYTRAHEAEADNIGMQTLVASGFDPNAMPSFFEKLQQASRFYGGDSVPEFLRTHPVTTNRIAEARGRASQLRSQPALRDLKQFYLVKEKVRVMMAKDAADLIAFYEPAMKQAKGIQLDALHYGYAMALLKSNAFTRAREALTPLIKQDRDQLAYAILLADIELAVGNVAAALSIYEENQKLYPDDAALILKQVNVLLCLGCPVDAEKLLNTQLAFNQNPSAVYKLMAQAKKQMGQNSESHAWYAEYYYSAGRLKAAVDQLKLAAESAGHDEYQRAKIASRLREVENSLALMEQER
jgi:predicted Zn-dependent protease